MSDGSKEFSQPPTSSGGVDAHHLSVRALLAHGAGEIGPSTRWSRHLLLAAGALGAEATS